jgi:hypothetical protein
MCSHKGPHLSQIFIGFHRYRTAKSFEVFHNYSSLLKELVCRWNKGAPNGATSPTPSVTYRRSNGRWKIFIVSQFLSRSKQIKNIVYKTFNYSTLRQCDGARFGRRVEEGAALTNMFLNSSINGRQELRAQLCYHLPTHNTLATEWVNESHSVSMVTTELGLWLCNTRVSTITELEKGGWGDAASCHHVTVKFDIQRTVHRDIFL